jgi:hypothetical protein
MAVLFTGFGIVKIEIGKKDKNIKKQRETEID